MNKLTFVVCSKFKSWCGIRNEKTRNSESFSLKDATGTGIRGTFAEAAKLELRARKAVTKNSPAVGALRSPKLATGRLKICNSKTRISIGLVVLLFSYSSLHLLNNVLKECKFPNYIHKWIQSTELMRVVRPRFLRRRLLTLGRMWVPLEWQWELQQEQSAPICPRFWECAATKRPSTQRLLRWLRGTISRVEMETYIEPQKQVVNQKSPHLSRTLIDQLRSCKQ